MALTDVELPDQGDNIIRTNDIIEFINPNGIANELLMSMKKHKKKHIQLDAVSGVVETSQAVLERAIRVACHLRRLGVTPKDILTPCTTNHLNTNVILFAIFFTGAKPACIDPGAPKEDTKRQLQLVKPKYVFASPEAVSYLEETIEKLGLNTKIVVFGKTGDHMSFDELLVPLPEEERNFSVFTTKNLFDTALIVFSSGTTGSPKGICITHYQLLISTSPSRLLRGRCLMSYSSLVWMSSIYLSLASAIGGQIKLLCSNFEIQKTWDYLAKYRVATALFSPHDFLALVKSGKPEGLELPDLKVFAPLGGAISPEIITAARKMLPTTLIMSSYSQTELWGFGMLPEFSPAGLAKTMKEPQTVGKPGKGLTYKIVDPETEEVLGPNKPGELRIKTKLVMNGYYKADSHHCFDSQGFLKTGDILYYDEDHWFFFVDRVKEMLRYKLCAVAPTELEAILTEHPSVKLAVVLGFPSDEGDIITAVVAKSDENVTAEELENMVASRVDDRKRLRGGVKFVDYSEIPLTPNGKIRRRALRQYLIEKQL